MPSTRVIIVASAGQEPVVSALEAELRRSSTPPIVSHCGAGLTEFSIDGLESFRVLLGSADCAILVLGPEDARYLRVRSPSRDTDRALLSIGIIVGCLGAERVLILSSSDSQAKELLAGLVTIRSVKYDPPPASEKSLKSACAAIGQWVLKRQSAERDAVEERTKRRVSKALEVMCRAVSLPHTPGEVGIRAFVFRLEGDKLVCAYHWAQDPVQKKELETKFNLREKKLQGDNIAVVEAVLSMETSEESPDPKNQEKLSRVKGVSDVIKFVLATPIRNEDQTPWGVVDLDAIDARGVSLLPATKARHALEGFAEHFLPLLLAIPDT